MASYACMRLEYIHIVQQDIRIQILIAQSSMGQIPDPYILKEEYSSIRLESKFVQYRAVALDENQNSYQIEQHKIQDSYVG